MTRMNVAGSCRGPYDAAVQDAEADTDPTSVPHPGVAGIGGALAALGIVFGDIGTSPIYAFRESFDHSGLTVVQSNTYGIASIVFWSLVIVISVKYLALVMRADNQGEGGILALTADERSLQSLRQLQRLQWNQWHQSLHRLHRLHRLRWLQ